MAPLLENKNGVRIEIYSREHLPPHIHAKYNEYEALVDIRTGQIFRGNLPSKKLQVAQDWLNESNRRELVEKNFYELNPRLATKDTGKEETGN